MQEPDPYVAYCLDEAGAWLVNQKEPPGYGGGTKQAFNDPAVLQMALKAGK